MTSKYRICKYDDGVMFAVEELIKGDWQYPLIYRPRESGMMDIRDMAYPTVDECRTAIARRIAKEKERIIEEF